jgi:putative transposase
MRNEANHRRRSIRLAGYDYSQAGAYFITICTHDRMALFGEIIENDVRLNPNGIIVTATWDQLPAHYPNIDLDAFIVMPNHIHGIIILTDVSSVRHGLPEIVRGFKTFSARGINERRQTGGTPLWQRGYYEHVIRNGKGLNRIRCYITDNPARWADDPDNLWAEGASKPVHPTRPVTR